MMTLEAIKANRWYIATEALVLSCTYACTLFMPKRGRGQYLSSPNLYVEGVKMADLEFADDARLSCHAWGVASNLLRELKDSGEEFQFVTMMDANRSCDLPPQ